MDLNASGPVSQDLLADKKSLLLPRPTEGATLLIVLQIGSRVLTFTANQLILRHLSPELLGISTQLEIYSLSVLFFSRESLRLAVQRQTDIIEDGDRSDSKSTEKGQFMKSVRSIKTQEIVNLSYISILLGVLFVTLLGWAYWRSLRSVPYILDTPYFKYALELYAVATFLELLAEPCFVVVQQKSEYRIRATADGAATVCRCLVTCSLSVLAACRGFNMGVLPFAIGQLSYGFVVTFIYYWRISGLASAQRFSLTPRRISPSKGAYVLSYFSPTFLKLGASLFAQGVLKYLLTQGDFILISYLASLHSQGIYALVSNYGGLIARVIFQPIEESSRNYFGKLLSTIDAKPSKALIQSASKELHDLIRFYVLLSVCTISIGPTLASPLLDLVAGPRWTSTGAGDVLAKYCYYIPLLAINGVTEAFISSIASEKELNWQSVWMLAFSIGYAIAGYVFLRVLHMGAEGLVWVNSFNMILRITWSYSFINGYLKSNGGKLSILEVMPQYLTLAAGICCSAIMTHVKANSRGSMDEVIKSSIIAALFVFMFLIFEWQYVLQCYRLVRR